MIGTDDWKEYALEDLLSYEQPTPYIVESTEYDDSYDVPVLTAGKSFILGYTNENFGVYDALPVIIFDDFTTATQFVNFKFKVKSSAMKILTANTELVLPKYIFYRMQAIQFDHSTHKRYWIQQYSKIKVKIPSLPEQEHIVARIEELFSQLDSGVETMKKTKQQLAVYRKTVYVSELNKYPKKTFKLKEVVETVEGDRGRDYPKREELFKNGYCLFLTAKNVSDFGWRFIDKSFIKKEKDEALHSGRVELNDVIITTRGTLGNVVVYDTSVPFDHVRINSCMLILRPYTSIISPYYLAQYLSSPLFKVQVENKKSGTAQPQIPARVLKDATLGVPSLENQEICVRILNQRLSVCDSIEQTINAALQQAEALRQSILKKAFEGGI